MAKKKVEAVLKVPVAFSNVNIGDETARVGISIGRGHLTVSQADKHLCGKRLTGTILARSNGATAEQGSLPGLDDDTEIRGIFDVKGFSASLKKISTGLTFALASVDIEKLSHFAKREGQLSVENIEALPEGEDDEEGE